MRNYVRRLLAVGGGVVGVWLCVVSSATAQEAPPPPAEAADKEKIETGIVVNFQYLRHGIPLFFLLAARRCEEDRPDADPPPRNNQG